MQREDAKSASGQQERLLNSPAVLVHHELVAGSVLTNSTVSSGHSQNAATPDVIDYVVAHLAMASR